MLGLPCGMQIIAAIDRDLWYVTFHQKVERCWMTKADLVVKIYEGFSCQKKEAVELVDLVMEILKEAIANEGHVKISGFGTFVVRQKADRNGRNPQTGETIRITSRKVVVFKPSVVLKNRINPK